MGVSFKVTKGTRFRPRPPPPETTEAVVEASESSKRNSPVADPKREAYISKEAVDASGGLDTSPEQEISFILNLLPDGFSIGKPTEKGELPPLLQDAPKLLHPYNRASETLFSAVESGWLPGDILDDIPCKYFDGAIMCEIRDYRKCWPGQGNTVSSMGETPIVNKVRLRLSLENVVKDIPLISDDSWTYSDLMEVESRIVKALQPKLCLDPTPMMDRLHGTPAFSKLNLGICGGKKKRLRATPEMAIVENSQAQGKRVCLDRLPENANCMSGDPGSMSAEAAGQHYYENKTMQPVLAGSIPDLRPKNFGQEISRQALPTIPLHRIQSATGYPRVVQDRVPGSPANQFGGNPNIPLASMHNAMSSYTNSGNSMEKSEIQDPQLTAISGMKRLRQPTLGLDNLQQHQQTGPSLDGRQGSDMQWKSPLQQQMEVKGIQYTNMHRYLPQAGLDGVTNQQAGAPFYLGQQSIRYGVKEEQVGLEKWNKKEVVNPKDSPHVVEPEINQMEQHQLRIQQMNQQPFSRSHFPPQSPWHSVGSVGEKDARKDDVLQKRKSAQSPRVSSGAVVQSPVSSKSGEISSSSLGGHFGAITTASILGSQKEKTAAVSNAAVGTPSVTSSPSDSVQHQHQMGKRKSNSIPKTTSMSGVASPASVSNMNAPLNANSPSVGNAPVDPVLLDRFSKIEMVTSKYKLNCKKNKVDNIPTRKPTGHSLQQLSICLAAAQNPEDFKDPIWPMSRSLMSGTMNTCKTRRLCLTRHERSFQGMVVVPKAGTSLTMREVGNDGHVLMQYGDDGDSDLPTSHDCSFTLPNTHFADLLAKQFCSLMLRAGFEIVEDKFHHPSTRTSPAAGCAPTVPGMTMENSAMAVQYQDAVPGARGPGPTAMSSSVGPIGGMGQNQMSMANLRSRPLMPAQAATMAAKLRMGNRAAAMFTDEPQCGCTTPYKPAVELPDTWLHW
ncbi:hypothetical protein QJS10_CPA09g00047 [Acorus calamus]|uniref:Uncharacterized protein n=1 Tax=Acorus calamus TaxID=4465 RepID=A0AAV9E455_ACOCL|nr:hypothetical protein QJS10_CPA09g00047 [Acorus calamus]